ncbi:MAG: 3-deoxy-7-phosphoheptulonate synthase [Bacteroidales bacterium]
MNKSYPEDNNILKREEIGRVEIPPIVKKMSERGAAVLKISDFEIGKCEVVIIAGPCAVESRQQIMDTAMAVKKSGARILRGGAFKPRTSPYSFQGLELEGLKFLKEAGLYTGMPVVTEVMDTRTVEKTAEYADVLQIGSRNMHNYTLLKEAGLAKRPVLLKRGMMATIEELLYAAEYLLKSGNHHVILCERGIRTFEPSTRNTIDLSAIPMLKKVTGFPVFADPSHGTGVSWLVPAMAKAAVAAGADGLMIEVHHKPEEALSDGYQSLSHQEFNNLMTDLQKVAEAVGRSIFQPEQ